MVARLFANMSRGVTASLLTVVVETTVIHGFVLDRVITSLLPDIN